MLEWDTTVQAPAPEDEATFRERVTTGGEFTSSYKGEGVGVDAYSYDGCVYLSSAEDDAAQGAPGEIVLSVAQMNQLARDWLRYRGRWPWLQDDE